MYTKRAVKYVGDGIPHVDCECGHAVTLPVIKGMPLTYVCGNCGIEYDSRGWIIARREWQPTDREISDINIRQLQNGKGCNDGSY